MTRAASTANGRERPAALFRVRIRRRGHHHVAARRIRERVETTVIIWRRDRMQGVRRRVHGTMRQRGVGWNSERRKVSARVIAPLASSSSLCQRRLIRTRSRETASASTFWRGRQAQGGGDRKGHRTKASCARRWVSRVLVGIWAFPWLGKAWRDSALEVSDDFGGRVAIKCRMS